MERVVVHGGPVDQDQGGGVPSPSWCPGEDGRAVWRGGQAAVQARALHPQGDLLQVLLTGSPVLRCQAGPGSDSYYVE